MLDLTRGVQGIGGAMMFACSLALIVQEFPAHERGIAFGVYGAINSLSVAVGPILGAILTQEIGWQAIFFINVPIAIFALLILQRKVVNLPGPPAQIDWGGLVTFSSASSSPSSRHTRQQIRLDERADPRVLRDGDRAVRLHPDRAAAQVPNVRSRPIR